MSVSLKREYDMTTVKRKYPVGIQSFEKLRKDGYLYVDKSAFKDDEILVNDKEDSRFVIGDTDVLEGVYCINKGYAVFRRIEVLDQNDEYAIVARDTDFGLVRYDHIVRDASSVKEQDILF